MHWKTYARLRKEAERLTELYNAEFLDRTERLHHLMDRIRQQLDQLSRRLTDEKKRQTQA